MTRPTLRGKQWRVGENQQSENSPHFSIVFIIEFVRILKKTSVKFDDRL